MAAVLIRKIVGFVVFSCFYFFIFQMLSVQLKAVVLGAPHTALAEDG